MNSGWKGHDEKEEMRGEEKDGGGGRVTCGKVYKMQKRIMEENMPDSKKGLMERKAQ
jgi:hypothetical protein